MPVPTKLLLGSGAVAASYFLPTPDVVGNTLAELLQNVWLILAVKSLGFFLFLAVPYATFQRLRRPSVTVQLKAITQIKDSALAKYDLRLATFSDDFKAITTKWGSHGFDLPPGMMNGEIVDLYRKELGVLCEIINGTINLHSSKNNKILNDSDLKNLYLELLQDKALNLKKLYSSFIDNCFSFLSNEMATSQKNNFNKLIDRECNLLIRSSI